MATVTLLASPWPLFSTLSVKVTSWPALVVAGERVSVSARSALVGTGMPADTESVLLAGTGSSLRTASITPETPPLGVPLVPAGLTGVTSFIVIGGAAPASSVERRQVTVLPDCWQLQPSPMADCTITIPAGTVKVTEGPFTVSGPLLVA